MPKTMIYLLHGVFPAAPPQSCPMTGYLGGWLRTSLSTYMMLVGLSHSGHLFTDAGTVRPAN